jgi:hypothetical protein
LQGPYTLPQRLAYLKDNASAPLEFVSIALLADIEQAGGIDAFMLNWLDNAAAELFIDLTRLCTESTMAKTNPRSGPTASKAARVKPPEKTPATAEDMAKAVAEAMTTDKPFSMFDVRKRAGALLGKAGKEQDDEKVWAQIRRDCGRMISTGEIQKVGDDTFQRSSK